MAASNHNCSITSLSNSGPFKSYGSVRKSQVTSGTFEHPVQSTDTIEGLAIKYSVTVSVVTEGLAIESVRSAASDNVNVSYS